MSTLVAHTPYHLELIDGREIEKPLPKKLHAIIQSYLIRALGSSLPDALRVLSELDVLCGRNHEDRLVPDVTVAARNAAYRDGDLLDPAILCVEILSPRQALSNLFDKAERLLVAGTPVCWIIWPESRQAWMYQENAMHEAIESLRAESEHGSFDISLAEMWAELD
jgi:Uma2 family endonuclease